MTMTNQSYNLWLWANWPVPRHVRAGISLRKGGVSLPPFDELNLGLHVDDDVKNVLNNRDILSQHLSLTSDPVWLDQLHSTNIIMVDNHTIAASADGSYTIEKNTACTVITADCVPILFCNAGGTKIAAIHAGWRGISSGIVEKAIRLFSKPNTIYVWIGPCISSDNYEVGKDMYDQCRNKKSILKTAFTKKNEDHWYCDLTKMVKTILYRTGVHQIYECGLCTYRMNKLFYSYRREGVTGRQASMIWME